MYLRAASLDSVMTQPLAELMSAVFSPLRSPQSPQATFLNRGWTKKDHPNVLFLFY